MKINKAVKRNRVQRPKMFGMISLSKAILCNINTRLLAQNLHFYLITFLNLCICTSLLRSTNKQETSDKSLMVAIGRKLILI